MSLIGLVRPVGACQRNCNLSSRPHCRHAWLVRADCVVRTIRIVRVDCVVRAFKFVRAIRTVTGTALFGLFALLESLALLDWSAFHQVISDIRIISVVVLVLWVFWFLELLGLLVYRVILVIRVVMVS